MIKRLIICFVLFLGSLPAIAQSKTVSGTVTATSDGFPLPGVNVLVQGTTTGTQTDFDGNYTIEASEGDILVFSYLGMKSKNVTVGANSSIDISMEEDASQLDEVVVTALGITKQKKSLSYATQDVSTEELTQARSTNVLDGLSGKVAGISITRGSSGVGSSSRVLLRGNRSITGNSAPIYVVDGAILNGDISNISPDDIEDISVLKGANAAALYGSRAANGAIIVTTKSGKGLDEGVTASLNFTTTVEDAILLTDYQNEYGQGSGGVYSPNATTSWGPRFDGSQVAHWSNDPNYSLNGQTYAYEAQPNNVKDFFRTGTTLNTNMSINVSKENSNTFISYTYTDASGIIKSNDLESHNLSLRNTSTIGKLTVDSKINYIRRDFRNVLFSGEGFDNPLRYSYIMPRNIRTEDLKSFEFINDEGALRQHFYAPNFNGAGNPYWTVNRVLRPRLEQRILGLLSLKYQITPDLYIMGRSALDQTGFKEETMRYYDTYTVAPQGSYRKYNESTFEWNSDVLINFNKDLSEKFGLDLNAGANMRVNQFDALGASGSSFKKENLFALSNLNTLDAVSGENDYDGFNRKLVNSVYGFGELSYDNAVFLNFSARNDWSSTLPSDNWSYFYPSVGLSAVVSDLVSLPEWFDFLKLRASWAEVGTDTDPYRLFSLASLVGSSIDISETLANSNLQPETTQSTDLGLDARFFNSRLNIGFTWYKSNTFDQLFQTPVEIGRGRTNVFRNGGDIQNTGVEITAGIDIVRSEDFSWDLNLNFTKNDSEVMKIIDGFDELQVGNADFVRAYKLVEGRPFGDIYSRGFLRDDAGNVIVDANGAPMITPGLDVQVANFNPDWLGGISNSFTYKNFNLSFLIDIRQGGSVIDYTGAILADSGLLESTVQGRDGSLVFGENIFSHETAVTETGSANNIQIGAEEFWGTIGGRNTPVGEAFVKDASNIRLRELILGYSLSQDVLDKTFFKSARVSLVGRNLFFISNKAESFDPESVISTDKSQEGSQAFAIPTSRSLGLSLNFGF
ncbi:SusC/RagA family TonB-linked outer membrane protein [Cytophaga sp. FL35]|uniref:SusC/RagA family TonB-linked outer membrane protein n=1 Tax=Cytophaga sp. FL35 TaxID=1904456 RepID=UPI0016535519|nr:SusC/RagA family TonB-linked outer membrane protein [Cytophaga sp. FL35]MBC6999181.1 SusC/RagA family TonB-linked outer membrane protein [Cytophaga sp. FL35]